VRIKQEFYLGRFFCQKPMKFVKIFLLESNKILKRIKYKIL